MPKLFLILTAFLLLQPFAFGDVRAGEGGGDVLTYHANAARDGNFIVPGLSFARAKDVHQDPGFHAEIRGHVYAQPLFWHDAKGRGEIFVATEDDSVYALDAASGKTIWKEKLGEPMPLSGLPCGNIDPLGITGTPVIEAGKEAIYLDAMLRGHDGTPKHEIFALSLKDGKVLSGWPVDIGAKLASQGFISATQGQRGALTILDHTLYVPYGGHFGDCGRYHGWVIGVKLDDPSKIASWHTGAQAGGIWAPAGISADEHGLFVATGNTMYAWRWGGGEAVIHLSPSLTFSGKSKDFFVPPDWRFLDAEDADLGGVGPILFDDGGKVLALALGKDGKAYLLDRDNLGGFGGSLAKKQVSFASIRTAAAAYPSANGTLVAFQAPGTGCRARGAALTVLRVRAYPSPSIDTAWCGTLRGRGAPIVTTTDGKSDPIVWMLGAEGDNRLYAFRGDTGERLFVSAPLAGLRRFQTLVAAGQRLYVAADDAVYAFGF